MPDSEYDDFNDMCVEVGKEAINAIFENIKISDDEKKGSKFMMDEVLEFEVSKENGVIYDQKKICNYLILKEKICNLEDNHRKLKFEYMDTEGEILTYCINCEKILNSKEIKEELVSHGFSSYIKSDKLFQKYLIQEHNRKGIPVIREVEHIGWVKNRTDCYVCPSFVCFKDNQTCLNGRVILNSSVGSAGYAQSGTLREWQEQVADLTTGNSLLTFALCLSLSPVLLRLIPEQSTKIFHIVGASSTGKTTVLKVAASVWGEPKNFIQQWRATANAQEGLAEGHNDSLLIMDEMGQASDREIGTIVYMVGNERGKPRMNADSTLRRIKEWKTMCLSSGEVSLIEKLALGGTKIHDGQFVRFINIDGDMKKNLGVFEELHDFSAHELSTTLAERSARYYGTAAEHFIRYIQSVDRESLQSTYRCSFENLQNYAEELLGYEKVKDGKVLRILQAFALIHAAGVLASTGNTSILPHSHDEIDADIKRVLNQCELRNNVDKGHEILTYIHERLNSNSRILPICTFENNRDKTIKLINANTYRAGEIYGYSQGEGKYYIYPTYFSLLFPKYETTEMKKALIKAGVLKVDENKKISNQKFTIGSERIRLMQLKFNT